MNSEEIKVKELIGECLFTKSMIAERFGVILVEDLDEPDALVRGDRQLLRTAMSNLIDAAIRHSQPGGKVAIGHRSDSMRQSIVVCGNGKGIPYDELRRMHDLFARSSMRAADDGDEIEPDLIGLSIVRDVADLHGGRVGVRSLEGSGSTFTLYLPRLPRRCA